MIPISTTLKGMTWTVFEMPSFEQGTLAIAKSVAKATSNGAFSLIGGGDSVAAILGGSAEEIASQIYGKGMARNYLILKVYDEDYTFVNFSVLPIAYFGLRIYGF